MNKVKFAIVTERTLAMCVQGDEHVDLSRGMTVEVREDRERNSEIVIRDYYQKNFAFENNLYLCKTSALFHVVGTHWPYLIAIPDPIMRANLAKDKSFMEYITNLQIDNYVTVNGNFFDISMVNQQLKFLKEREPRERSNDYECIIRSIGPVDEIGPGYLFGLELLVILSEGKC